MDTTLLGLGLTDEVETLNKAAEDLHGSKEALEATENMLYAQQQAVSRAERTYWDAVTTLVEAEQAEGIYHEDYALIAVATGKDGEVVLMQRQYFDKLTVGGNTDYREYDLLLANAYEHKSGNTEEMSALSGIGVPISSALADTSVLMLIGLFAAIAVGVITHKIYAVS